METSAHPTSGRRCWCCPISQIRCLRPGDVSSPLGSLLLRNSPRWGTRPLQPHASPPPSRVSEKCSSHLHIAFPVTTSVIDACYRKVGKVQDEETPTSKSTSHVVALSPLGPSVALSVGLTGALLGWRRSLEGQPSSPPTSLSPVF